MVDISKPPQRARIREGCNCGCNTPVATDAIGMLEFLAGRFEHAGVSSAVAETYAHDIRFILANMREARPVSELTDAELADPKYMRSYIEELHETTRMFADRASDLQAKLDAYTGRTGS